MRRADPLIGLLALLVFTDTFGYAIVLPLLPLAAQRRGACVVAVGVLFATYSACQLVSAPILGRLSDRLGRRRLLLASLLGSAGGFGLMLVGGYWALLLSRVVDGCTAGNVSIVNAIVLDRYPAADWGNRFTTLSTATGAGIVLGVGVSAVLARYGLASAALIAIGLNLVSISILWVRLPETVRPSGNSEPVQTWALPSLRIRHALPTALFAAIVQSAFLLTLPLYFNRLFGWREAQTTIAIAGLVGLAAAFQLVAVSKLMTIFGPGRSALLGYGLILVGGLGLATAVTPSTVLPAAASAVLGIAILSPVIPTLIGLHNPTQGKGDLMGVNQSIASSGQMAGPLLGYGAVQVFASSGYGAACAALAAAGLALTYPLREKRT